MNAFWIITTGSLVAITCSLLGCYLILRKMAMIGDAISHAVLPGIVIAFLYTGQRDSMVMLFAAALTGVFTTLLIELIHKKGKLQTDASIGVTFTLLFAIGIIMISVFAGQVDLDQDCVLYGEIAYVPFDVWLLDSGINLGPRAIWVLGGVLLIIIAFITLGYKPLYATTFDPGFAFTIGISIPLWHYLLMSLVSITTVASFEIVGAILVIAFLVVPPATAYLLTDDFKKMLMISSGIGILTAGSGYYLAVAINGSIAGAMAVMAGIFFALAFFFSPSHGLLFKKLRKKRALLQGHEEGATTI